MKFLLFTIAVLVCIGQTLAKCPTVPTLDYEKVDFTKYSGKWYQVASKPDISELNFKCYSADISKANTTAYSINYNSISKIDNKPITINTWLARNIYRPEKPYEYYLYFLPYGLQRGTYGIVDTDYNNYAIIYSCSDKTGITQEKFYINSRTQGLTAYNSQLILAALSKLTGYGVNTSGYVNNILTEKCN